MIFSQISRWWRLLPHWSSNVGMIVVIVMMVSGCIPADSWVLESPGSDWSAQYGNAGNTSWVPGAAPQMLHLDWRRDLKGTLGAQPGIGPDDWLILNGQTDQGCSLMEWEGANHGRQRWCTRLYQGGGDSGGLMDQFNNVYVGQPGAILSFPPTQWIRWRAAVVGMPLTPRFLSPGRLLVATHLGQIQVFHAHQGVPIGAPVELINGIDPQDFRRGLEDCDSAKSECPVSAAPAFSSRTGMIILHLWKPHTPASVVVGLKYHPDTDPVLTQQWQTDVIHAGVVSSPVINQEGTIVYLQGKDHRLWALNTHDGSVKWSIPLAGTAFVPPAVSDEGLIISPANRGQGLIGVIDRGDHGEQIWARHDIHVDSAVSLIGSVGYVVTRDNSQQMSLLVFHSHDGTTISTVPLPDGHGIPLGVAIDTHHRIVVTTTAGQVFSFSAVTSPS